MAIQFSTALRNYMLNGGLPNTNGGNVWDTVLAGGGAGTASTLLIYTGSPPSNCAAAATGTQLAALNPIPHAPSPFNASSGGSTTMNNTVGAVSPTNTISFVAGVGGTAGYFRLTDSDLTCHIQGTCGIPASGADLIMSTTAILAGQTLVITGFTFTAPGA